MLCEQCEAEEAASMTRRIPLDGYVIVIGAMKCGTSTLFEYLSLHGEIVGSKVKEPEYFSENQDHGMMVETYSDLWDYDPDKHRYCIEASTGYTKYPDEMHVPDRMLEAGIDPKFIYVVRNPFDRMESQINHGFIRRTGWSHKDFLEPGVLNLSRYYMQMQQYLTRFPDRSRYYIVDFDKLIEDPGTTVNDILRWLELQPVDLPDHFHAHKTPELSRPELLIRDLHLSRPLSIVPQTVKRTIQGVLRAHLPARKRMTRAERSQAKAHLERDIHKFAETFDFAVGKWGF